jgi:hypothetical protein
MQNEFRLSIKNTQRKIGDVRYIVEFCKQNAHKHKKSSCA